VNHLLARLKPFFDLSAWVLILVALVPLMFYDRAMAVTLVQWTIVGLALAGIAVVITRVAFPQLCVERLMAMVDSGHGPSMDAASRVLQSLLILFGFIFLGLVLWAKA
jgi:hypothetical protein